MQPLQSRCQREEGEVAVAPFSLPLPLLDPQELGNLKVGGALYEAAADWDHPHGSVWTNACPHTLQSDCALWGENIDN